jgi:hypothetical protein
MIEIQYKEAAEFNVNVVHEHPHRSAAMKLPCNYVRFEAVISRGALHHILWENFILYMTKLTNYIILTLGTLY